MSISLPTATIRRLKKLLLYVFLLCSFTLTGQIFKSGTVHDYYSHTSLDSVKVTSLILDTIVMTDRSGRFIIPTPPGYYDTLVFTRPGYYPFVRVTKKAGYRINLIPRTVEIDTICYPSYKKNRLLQGTIVEKYLKKPVAGASVRLWNDQLIAWSDRYGKFSVGIPRSTKMLKISHPDYEPQMVEFKRGTPMIVVKMLLRKGLADTTWKTYNNMFALLPLEIATGSIGLFYQHFVKLRHAVGVYSSVYLFGYGHALFSGGTAKYKGFKLSPSYRFYVWRNVKTGGYIQGKVTVGYFNFSKLYYTWDVDSRYGEYRSEQFWNAGFGVAWGWSMKLPKSNHGVFNITVGYQYFTMSVPPTTYSPHYGTLDVQSGWWYFVGPGSRFEVKLMFGGIF